MIVRTYFADHLYELLSQRRLQLHAINSTTRVRLRGCDVNVHLTSLHYTDIGPTKDRRQGSFEAFAGSEHLDTAMGPWWMMPHRSIRTTTPCSQGFHNGPRPNSSLPNALAMLHTTDRTFFHFNSSPPSRPSSAEQPPRVLPTSPLSGVWLPPSPSHPCSVLSASLQRPFLSMLFDAASAPFS